MLILGALAALYVAGVVRGSRGGHRLSLRHGLTFAAGVAALFLTLGSPLHHLSDDVSFTAHMVQHQLLTLVVPPLLLLGIPVWMAEPVLNVRWLARFGRQRAYPVVAFLAFNLLFAYAHFPAIYDRVFGIELLHRATHVVFLLTATVRWLPLLSPAPAILPRLSSPGQMLYCFLQSIPGSVVGSLLTLSDRVLFTRYAMRPPDVGFGLLEDQQLGGLLMWVVEGTFWLAVLTVIFFRWADREERRLFG